MPFQSFFSSCKLSLTLCLLGSVAGWFSLELFQSMLDEILWCCYSNARGVLLRILCGDVSPGSPKPDPLSDQNMWFSTSVFRPGGGHETQHYMFTQNRNYVIIAEIKTVTKRFLKILFEFTYYTFFLIHLELKRQTLWYTTVVPSKTIPDSRTKWAKSIPVFRPKRRKNPTFWGGTCLYGLY